MVANRQFHRLSRYARAGEPSRQDGIGLFGWIAIILMLGVIGLAVLRLVPLYVNYYTVLDVAKGLQADPTMARKSKGELKSIVTQRFRQNNLYDMDPTIIKFSKNKNQRLLVRIDYEARVNLFGNLDLVARFDRTLLPI